MKITNPMEHGKGLFCPRLKVELRHVTGLCMNGFNFNPTYDACLKDNWQPEWRAQHDKQTSLCEGDAEIQLSGGQAVVTWNINQNNKRSWSMKGVQ